MHDLKKISTVIFVLLFFQNVPVALSTAGDKEALARNILTYLVNEEPEKILPYFDETMQLYLSTRQLSSIWRGIVEKHGAFKLVKKTWTEGAPGNEIVVQRCEFKRGTVQFRITFDENERIAGLFFQPDTE